jgi:tetratricopeptide (TPR) repeat protein
MRLLFTVLVLFCCSVTPLKNNACTIFVMPDGNTVWVGNNEDGPSSLTYRFWYYPATRNHFGYMLWSELLSFKPANGLMYKVPQGGLNEYGLFMDYTAIAEQPATENEGRKNRKKQVVTDILRQCKTVQEALQYINKYNLTGLTSAQLLIADAGGDYATVHGGYTVPKEGNAFALTNYCIKDGRKVACWRRDAVMKYINNPQVTGLPGVVQVLKQASQKSPNEDITNYSLAANLKEQKLYVYHKGDFKTTVALNLKEELKKGKHHKNVHAYFPESVSILFNKVSEEKGMEAAVNLYRQYRLSNNKKYNFNNADAMHTAVMLIEQKRYKDALLLLNCQLEFEPNNLQLYNWLGVAHRIAGDTIKSDSCFAKVLAQNPDDYLATLYGRQQNRKVVFKVKEFESAETVLLAGDFTNWRKNAIAMRRENGYWLAEVQLPPGEITYKLIVNKQYEAEHVNWLHTLNEKAVVNKLWVW